MLGRDLRAGLADLVGVRAPAGAGHGARAADGAAEQLGELLDDREPLGRADPATAATRPRSRRRARRRPSRRRHALGDRDGERRLAGRLTTASARRRRRRPPRPRGGRRQEQRRAVQLRLLEQAAAPAHARHASAGRRARPTCSWRPSAGRGSRRRGPAPRCRGRSRRATTAGGERARRSCSASVVPHAAGRVSVATADRDRADVGVAIACARARSACCARARRRGPRRRPEHAHSTPSSLSTLDHGGRRLGAGAEHLRLLARARRAAPA